MEYPKYLLPNRYFRIFSLDELPKDPEYFIVRRSLESSENTFDDFGFLTAESILGTSPNTDSLNVKQVAGLSLNLLGGRFNVPHLRFRPLQLAMKDWDPSKPRVKFSIIKKDIDDLQGKPVPIFFLLKSVHRKSFPYTRVFDKDL